MKAIEVSGLRKRYGDHVAVRDLSFSVDEGEVLARAQTEIEHENPEQLFVTGFAAILDYAERRMRRRLAEFPPGTYQVYYVAPTPEPVDPAKGRAPVVVSVVPKKYQDLKTSGLSFEVQAGKNDIPIELKN